MAAIHHFKFLKISNF